MRVHEREKIVREAQSDLSEKLLDWMTKHDDQLTFAEELRVIAGVLGDHLSQMAKYEIRRERHGDENKPGGLE